MKILQLCAFLIILCCASSVEAAMPVGKQDNPVKVQQFINHKDWNFVENKGQLGSSDIKYYGHQGGVYLYCKPGMLSFVFTKAESKETDQISEATGLPSGNNSPFPKGNDI